MGWGREDTDVGQMPVTGQLWQRELIEILVVQNWSVDGEVGIGVLRKEKRCNHLDPWESQGLGKYGSIKGPLQVGIKNS